MNELINGHYTIYYTTNYLFPVLSFSEEKDTIEERKRLLDEEIEKLVERKQAMEEFDEELKRREEIVKKREDLLAEKNTLEMKKLRASQVLTQVGFILCSE